MGSATSADAKKQEHREERHKHREKKIQKRAERKILNKQKQREQIFENHEDFDDDGNAFFYDDFGQRFYLDDDLVPYYLDEKKERYYFDRNGHKFYLDERGRPYHVDDYGERCHWDEMNQPYYTSEDGDIFYLDSDREKYFLDNERMPYYIDDANNKIWIHSDCLDQSGGVISRTVSRKAIKQAKINTGIAEIGEVTDKDRNTESDSDMIKSPSAVSISSKASTLGHRQTSFKSRELSWLQPSSSGSRSRDVASTASVARLNETYTMSRSSLQVPDDDLGLSRYRTLTPEVDKIVDEQNEDVTPEDIARTQVEADKKILNKILKVEMDKGTLPPRKLSRKVGHYSVKEKTDKKDCSITGSAFLPNGNLVISDFHNKNLKMYDPDLKFVTDLNLDTYPENMCARAQDSEIYISFKSGMQYGIMVVKVTDDTMSIVKTLQTKGQSYGICSNNGGLAVIVNNVHGWQIHLLDLKGVVKKQLSVEDSDEQPLLKRPDYLSVTRDLRLLISDRGANSVFCFDILSEELCFEYKDIREPYGVCCNKEGSIFVTSPGGVHQISNTGERIAQLLTREEIGFSPTSACYDEDDCLLVLTGQSNNMAAFQLFDNRD